MKLTFKIWAVFSIEYYFNFFALGLQCHSCESGSFLQRKCLEVKNSECQYGNHLTNATIRTCDSTERKIETACVTILHMKENKLKYDIEVVARNCSVLSLEDGCTEVDFEDFDKYFTEEMANNLKLYAGWGSEFAICSCRRNNCNKHINERLNQDKNQTIHSKYDVNTHSFTN